MQNQSTLTNASPPVRFSPLRVIVGLGLLGLLYWLGSTVGEYVPQFAEWVDDQGAWGPTVFIVGYAFLTVAFVSGALLTLTAGAIFGIVEGTIYVFVAATLGASIAFLVARSISPGGFCGSRMGESGRSRVSGRSPPKLPRRFYAPGCQWDSTTAETLWSWSILRGPLCRPLPTLGLPRSRRHFQ